MREICVWYGMVGIVLTACHWPLYSLFICCEIVQKCTNTHSCNRE